MYMYSTDVLTEACRFAGNNPVRFLGGVFIAVVSSFAGHVSRCILPAQSNATQRFHKRSRRRQTLAQTMPLLDLLSEIADATPNPSGKARCTKYARSSEPVRP